MADPREDERQDYSGQSEQTAQGVGQREREELREGQPQRAPPYPLEVDL